MEVKESGSRTRALAKTAVLAATYVALVLLLAPISFGAIQVRVADALVGLVPLLGMPGVAGITLGVFIGNIPSPLGPLDLLSTVPTFISCLIIMWLRRRSVLAGLISYSVILAAWVGYLLNYVFGLPFLITFAYLLVGIGFATAGLGYLLYRAMRRILGEPA
ncbi:MAG: QueT transporter family protein [Candidatus Verstraetearchaeota archaeon]|nr:QueT transporter family protein [Candidatus Verstraetearchaeota archaeon]